MKEWLSGYITRAHKNDATKIMVLCEHSSQEEAEAEAQTTADSDQDQQVVLRVVSATAPRETTARYPLYTPDHPALR